MNLQSEPAFQRNFLLRFGEVNRLFAVEPNFYDGTLGPNPHLVPFPLWIDPGVDFILGRLSEHLSPARLVVQETPDRSLAPTPYVALVTDHFVMLRDALASELDACIVSRADQLGFEAQFKVAVFLFADEEFVVGNFLVQKASYDGAFFHPEEFLLAFPTLEGLSVEKGYEAFVLFLLDSEKAGSKEEKE